MAQDGVCEADLFFRRDCFDVFYGFVDDSMRTCFGAVDKFVCPDSESVEQLVGYSFNRSAGEFGYHCIDGFCVSDGSEDKVSGALFFVGLLQEFVQNGADVVAFWVALVENLCCDGTGGFWIIAGHGLII